jgi:hypothetical protein
MVFGQFCLTVEKLFCLSKKFYEYRKQGLHGHSFLHKLVPELVYLICNLQIM